MHTIFTGHTEPARSLFIAGTANILHTIGQHALIQKVDIKAKNQIVVDQEVQYDTMPMEELIPGLQLMHVLNNEQWREAEVLPGSGKTILHQIDRHLKYDPVRIARFEGLLN